MSRVVEYSYDQGLQTVLDLQFGRKRTELGFGFLRSAMDTGRRDWLKRPRYLDLQGSIPANPR